MRVLISVVLLAILFSFKQVDVPGLINEVKKADKAFLALSFLVFLLIYILGLLRWQMLLRAIKVKLPLKRVVTSFSGGLFFSLFLPSSIGGDVARSIDLSRHTQKPKEIVATVLLDRLSGYVGLVIVVLIAMVPGYSMVGKDPVVLVSIGLIIAMLALILLVLFNRFAYNKIVKLLRKPSAGKIRTALNSLLQEIHYFRRHKMVMFYNLLLSVVIQILGPAVFYMTSLAIGTPKINPVYFFIFGPIISAITLLPISLGGFGLRENTAVIFFAKAGLNGNSAAAIAFLNSIFIFIAGAIGGLIYVFTVHHRRPQHGKAPGVQPGA